LDLGGLVPLGAAHVVDAAAGERDDVHAMVDVRRLPVGEDNEVAGTLDDLAREGARRMIATRRHRS
jgi:hypothetical protein